MIIEFWTGREVKDNGKCDNCKYNCGYKVKNPSIIWCDYKICNLDKNKIKNCDYYKFKYGEE